MSNDTRIGVDVAKAVFEIAVSDRPGHIVRRERATRAQFLPFMAQQPKATVVMEACGSAPPNKLARIVWAVWSRQQPFVLIKAA